MGDARIIERVGTEYVTVTDEYITCDTCGSGTTRITPEGKIPHPCPSRIGRRVIIVDGDYQNDPTDEGRPCPGVTYYDVREYEQKVPGHIVLGCPCGEELHAHIGQFTITCDRCGADYNSAGQRLADRSQWGEETGETYADIVGPSRDAWED